MDKKILVTYASKHGSTKEIADTISAHLSAAGVNADVIPVENVNNLDHYDVVILGTAVYIGQWRKTIVKFLKSNKNELTKKEVWIFATGPTGEGEPDELLKGWKYPEALKPLIETIKPVDIKIFHGVLDETKLNALEKMTIKMVKAPMGDFRNWEDIENWSKEISAPGQ